MHLLEKIFCRVVQFGFRTVLPVLPYKDPAVLNSVADIPVLAEHAAAEANPLYPVPVLMDAKELERFYYAIMEQPKAKKAENGRDIAA